MGDEIVVRHLGITYATAARFAPPVPVPWDGTWSDRFGPSAPQRTSGPLVEAVPGMRVGEQREDCLTLNVWAPEGADGLPVIVWIHGGAYVIGGSSLPSYDPSRLVELGDVVVVSCNYRLGALANLVVDGATDRGMLDQLAALRWVRDNIARLGGDPANVTVFGESAGAGGILHLLGAPAADGLFRRVILQSPGAEVIHRPAANALAEAFGAHAALDAPVADVLDAQEAAAKEVSRLFGSMPWAPVVDGDLLPSAPQERIAGGGVAGVDVLLGTTAAELALFSGLLTADVAPRVLRHLLRPVLGRNPDLGACERIVAAYGEDVTGALSDAVMVAPLLRLADDLAAHHPGAYVYRFDWDGGRLGACHAADVPFTFGTFDVDGWAEFVGADDDARRLSDEMIRAWTSFARTGDPGWPAYDAARRQAMLLGRASRVTEHPLTERLPLLEEV